MGQYGVGRGLTGDYPKDYTDKDAAYTPAWQEIFTGVDSKTVLQFAREWANTAATTAGQVHDHHRRRYQPLVPRQPDVPRRRHGADAVGLRRQERRRPQPLRRPGEARARRLLGGHRLRQGLAVAPSRLQQAPLWHYINTCQYRYDGQFSSYNTVPKNELDRAAHRRHHLPVGAHGLDALLPAVQAEHARAGPRSASKGGAKTDDDITGLRARQAEEQEARVLGRRPRRARELPARLVHLARQRHHGQHEGPRVRPQALPRARTPTRSARTPTSTRRR